ncbi:Predicted outer membrane protein [Micromonospora pattaloongensis]|uniref:Predicted outer membrane protein n=1 Tax=Micromonospora pattaloongensis TaxID=405436 RepID=A0A1H3K140_9ACTN|nr:DUF4142 domain-containing protein [Micromonospora pattaloongensis]SDY45903.1 Predicted outer membrane protein [Micromonospora pattaloongensis]
MVSASRPRRAMRWAAAVVAGLTSGLVGLAPATAEAATRVPARAAAGPLTSADQDLLVKVRLAGLWEMPAGQMAAEKGSNKRVREIGAEIAKQHAELDRLTVVAAGKLGVPLPDEPNTDQRFWLREMTEASGPQFDTIFVDRLRAAHGKVFPAIANVRAGTRNDVVRELAQAANGFVLNHLTMLESTGLVDYEGLPRPAGPAGAVYTNDGTLLEGAVARANADGINASIITIVLAAAVVAGVIATFRVIRSR